MKQIRNFVFTINHPQIEDFDGLFAIAAVYMIIGEEVGESGTNHLQGYIELTKRVTFGKLKALIPRAHIEPRAGTQAQAITYCKKEGKYYEFGKPRKQGSREDITAIREFISEGNNLRGLFLSDGEINLNANTIRIAEKLFKYFEPPRDYKPTVLWLYGATGCGKTYTARELLPKAYFYANSTGKWWNGYDGHQDIIIDDIREENFPFVSLLGLLDRYPYQVEDKGSIREFRGKRIIITAPTGPAETYGSTLEDMEQLRRRIDHVIMVDMKDDFYAQDFETIALWLNDDPDDILLNPEYENKE